MPYQGNYRDNLLAQLMFQQRYPEGDTKVVDGKEVAIDPLYQNQEAHRGARAQASLGEDAMLRNQLGGKSERTDKDGPPGHYTLARYPGVEGDIWSVEHGFGGKGMQGSTMRQEMSMSPQELVALDKKRKAWAAHQRKLIGIAGPGESLQKYKQPTVWGNR